MSAEPTGGHTDERDHRIALLEQKLATLEKKVPETGVINGSFLKRAFTIWGHYFVANLIIGAGVAVCVGFFMLLMLFSGAALFNW